MPARPTRLRLDRLEDRLTPAGNVLAVIKPLHGDQQIQEFAPDGSLVRTLTPPRTGGARDVIVGPNGDIHLYVGNEYLSGGDLPTELDTYHAATGTWTSWTVPGWSPQGSESEGGLAAYGDYVYASDMEMGTETPPDSGIVRFDLAHQTVERFAAGNDYLSLTLGLDGVLYATRLYRGAFLIDKYHPVTMAYLGTVTARLDGKAAVGPDGTIYLADGFPTGSIYRLDPAGNYMDAVNSTRDVGSDVSVAHDGTVLGGDALMNPDLTNPRHIGFSSFEVAFADPQVPDRLPTLGGDPPPTGYTEGDPPLAVAPALAVSDEYGPSAFAATVAITKNFDPGGDVLAFTPQGGITGSYDPATGVLTLTGVASTADYQAVLRSVTYASTTDDPSDRDRTIVVQVTDGGPAGGRSNRVGRWIVFFAVDDPPAITVPSLPAVGPEGADIRLTGISLADVDARAGDLSLHFSAPQGTVRFADLSGLTVTGGTNGGPAVEVTGTLAALNAALRAGNLLYHPPDGLSGPVTVSVSANDHGNTQTGQGAAAYDFKTTSVLVIHRTPLLVGIETAPAVFTEGPGKVRVSGRVNPFSVDGTLAGATVAITTNFTGAEDRLAWTAPRGITASYDPVFGVLTLTGRAPIARYRAALRSVRYWNVSHDPDPGPRSVQFQVTDGTPDGWSNGVSRVVRIRPVNTAPVLTVPAADVVGPSNADIAVNGIQAADVDARGGIERITLRAAHGTIHLGNMYGLTIVGGANGSGLVVVEGTLDRLNLTMVLGELVYHPATDFAGTDVLTVTLNDRGHTGVGGARTVTRAVHIRVG
jgi:hypothetical protein